MKVKLGDLMESFDALSALDKKELPMAMARRVHPIYEVVQKEVSETARLEQTLVNKLGGKMELLSSGRVSIFFGDKDFDKMNEFEKIAANEKLRKFTEERDELYVVELEIPGEFIKKDEMEIALERKKETISGEHLGMLRWLIV